MRSLGFGGPVGLLHASLGFTASVLVARTWEYFARERHCIPTCPSFTSEALRPHHFYYGVAIFSVSACLLFSADRQRVRWDSSLLLGIGTGLIADEAGLLFFGVPYNNTLSLLLIGIFGVSLILGTINAAVRDGVREFRVLDHYDALTVAAVFLALSGFLYLDRPLIVRLELFGVISWASAASLFLLFGKTHFSRTWKGPG